MSVRCCLKVVVFASFLLLASFSFNLRSLAVAQGPILSISDHHSGQSGEVVQVPVNFSSGGQGIAGTTFSIDFDESCLRLDTADHNSDGLPDSVHILVRGGFQTSVSVDINDSDGEVDVTIADYSPPFAALVDQTLLSLDFTVICTPDPSETRSAMIGFSQLPRPSFSDADGRDVAGSSVAGAVHVLGSQVDTRTPTVTSIPTATATPSATATTASGATNPATPTATATQTTVPIATTIRYYFPFVVK